MQNANMEEINQNWLVGIQRSIEDSSYTFKVFSKPMPDEAFNEFERIVQVLADLRPTIVDYLACIQAFEGLAQLQNSLSLEVSKMQSHFRIGETAIQRHASLQRHIDSFLCSTSGFRDRLVWRIEKLGGSKDRLKEFLSRIFDRSPEYGMGYYLRNFSQHFNSIIHRIPIRAKDLDTDNPQISVSLEIDRDELIALSAELDDGHNIRKKLIPILEKMPSKIPLLELCRAYLMQLKSVLLFALKLKDPELLEYVGYIKAVKRVVGSDYEPAIFNGTLESIKNAGIGQQTNVHATLFSIDEFEYLVTLLKQGI